MKDLFAFVSVAVLVVDAPAGKLPEKAVVPARLFPLDEVRLTDPELLKIRELDHRYLLSLDNDRLLRNYRENAGIRTGLPELSGHEMVTGQHHAPRGHYTGHYLSASAMMVASTGDAKLKTKADALVSELAKLQKPNGYLAAQPEESFDQQRIPWYVQHKLLAGLLDMYINAGNQQALEVARKFADWAVAHTAKIDRPAMQRLLEREFGGFGEAMAELAHTTGEGKYLEAAKRFDQDQMLNPMAAGQDNLTGLHANTAIPKFVDAARKYEMTGEEHYRKASSFFWRQVALHRSYATGGNSISEGFRTPPDVLSTAIGPDTQESCNTYNMLKLTEHIFAWNPDAVTGDFHERALYNHILATPHPESGMPLYFLGLKPGQWKIHFDPGNAFWCCSGTGLENFAKLQRGIYYQGNQQLWVNLFIASELNWRDKGITISQQTAFPDEPGTRLVIKASKATAFKLNVRIPYWAEGASIAVNGRKLDAPLKAQSFASIDRTWNNGDEVTLTLPMRLHLQPMPDDPKMAAVMYGPLVLAGELGKIPEDKLHRESHAPFEVFTPYPEADKLALAGLTTQLEECIRPLPGKPLTFKTHGVGRPEDFVLSPLYRLFGKRYNVYWKLTQPDR